jgi:ribonuclease HI
VLAELAEGIGVATNNVAEFHGLVAALAWARDRQLMNCTSKATRSC